MKPFAMIDNNRLTGSSFRRPAWCVWAVGFLVWTYLLVVPTDWLPPWLRFGSGGPGGGLGWGKIGHVGVYAGLTALAMCLAAGGPLRWTFLAVMSAHAFGTEGIQTLVPTRSGAWSDVGIDHIGVVTGLLLSRLCDWGAGRPGKGRPLRKGVSAAPQSAAGAGRENAQADPL